MGMRARHPSLNSNCDTYALNVKALGEILSVYAGVSWFELYNASLWYSSYLDVFGMLRLAH